MYSQTTGGVSVSCEIHHDVFSRFPVLTDAVIQRLVTSELMDPLTLDSKYSPQKICLTPERLKQAIKETHNRVQVRALKDQGSLTPERLQDMATALHPFNEMMHFYWRQVAIVRETMPGILQQWIGDRRAQIVENALCKNIRVDIGFYCVSERTPLAA